MDWRSGNSAGHISERPTRLVLGWVTVCRYTDSVSNRPLRPAQPPILSGTGNEYRPRGSGLAAGNIGADRSTTLWRSTETAKPEGPKIEARSSKGGVLWRGCSPHYQLGGL